MKYIFYVSEEAKEQTIHLLATINIIEMYT